MARAVITVLSLLVVMAYVSLFLAWNAAPAPVTTWELGSKYTQDMPVGFLFIGGVMVGAVAMAVALWAPWKALKGAEQQQRALVEKAKRKLKSQDKEIKSLTAELEEEQARPEAAAASGDAVAPSEEEAAAVAAVESSETAPGPPDAEPEEPQDDPEVV